jgi:hypothetical protein
MNVQCHARSLAGLVPLALALAACDPFLGIGADGHNLRRSIERQLRVAVTYRIVERNGVPELQPSLVATNTGIVPISAEARGVPWHLRAYTSPRRTGTPVWRARQMNGDIARLIEIPPGESVAFPMPWTPLDEIVQDRPPRTYYFTVRLELGERFGGPTSELEAGQAVLPGAH